MTARHRAPRGAGGSRGLAAVVLGMLGIGGCTTPAEDSRFETEPGALRVVSTIPASGSSVSTIPRAVELCWSDRLDPRTVEDDAAVLASGRARFDTQVSVQLFPWRGPGGEALAGGATDPWCGGSVISVAPISTLDPGVAYRLLLTARPVGWRGEDVDHQAGAWTRDDEGEWFYAYEFAVDPAARPDRPALDPEAIRLRDLFASGRVFDPARDACGCHREAGSDAQRLLDLRTADTAFVDLVGSTRARDTGFPMVVPHKPSESFLVHKLLRDAEGHPLEGLLGEPMPPEAPLPYGDLVEIAGWIEAGAMR